MLHRTYELSPGWGWLKTHKHLTGTQEDRKTSPLCLYRKLEPFSMLLSGFAIIKSQPRWFFGFLRLEPGKKAAEGFMGFFCCRRCNLSCLSPKQTSQMNHVQPYVEKSSILRVTISEVSWWLCPTVSDRHHTGILCTPAGPEPNNCWEKPDNNHGLLEAGVESGTSAWQPGHIKWEKKPSLSSKARKQFP